MWSSAAGVTRRFFRTNPRLDVSMNGSESIPSISGSRKSRPGRAFVFPAVQKLFPEQAWASRSGFSAPGDEHQLQRTKKSATEERIVSRCGRSASQFQSSVPRSEKRLPGREQHDSEDNSATRKRTAAPRTGERLHEQNFISPSDDPLRWSGEWPSSPLINYEYRRSSTKRAPARRDDPPSLCFVVAGRAYPKVDL